MVLTRCAACAASDLGPCCAAAVRSLSVRLRPRAVLLPCAPCVGLVWAQIAFADRLILNKTDLVDGEADLARIEARLRGINKYAPIVRCQQASIAMEQVRADADDGTPPTAPARKAAATPAHTLFRRLPFFRGVRRECRAADCATHAL